MTRITSLLALNMDDIPVIQSGDISYTSFDWGYTLSMTSGFASYYGDFHTGELGDLVGRLTAIHDVYYGAFDYRIFDFNVDYDTAVTKVLQGGVEGLFKFLLNANDRVSGSQYSDRLFGYNGNDRVIGNAGRDSLFGGSGNDTLDGGTGSDWVCFEGTAAVTVNLSDGSCHSAVSGSDTLLSIENIYSDGGSDKLSGNQRSNTLDSGGGNDTLRGGAGNDSIWGGLGIDLLFGGAGNDEIRGGSGRDRLFGGLGSDTFVFGFSRLASSADRIYDFSPSHDSIHLNRRIFDTLPEGVLDVTAFTSNQTGLALDHSDRIIYENDSGRVFFDRDGSGTSSRALIAVMAPNLGVTSADFIIIGE